MPEDHVVTRRRGRILGPKPPWFMDEPEYGLHEHTVEQEVRTLKNRHLFSTPQPNLGSKAWGRFKREMRALSKLVGRVPRACVSEVIGNRSSMKRKRFGGGMERYCRLGIRRQDSFLTEMQKLEFYAEDKIELKEDRGIQFRSPTYNAALARHLHHFEHRLYSRARNEDGTPQIAKGRSPIERGLLLAGMSESFSDPVYVLMDHSRFDAHVNWELLEEEHKMYLRARGYNQELWQLLQWQKKNIGFSHGGIVYRIKAKRCSGDLNTGLGNSAINLGLIKSWLSLSGVTKYRILLDGDDSVVIIERADIAAVDIVKAHMLECGMVTEVEVVDDIQRAEFCQSRVCWGALGPTMVRNPHKVLDVLTKSPRWLDDKQARGVLAASALGELMQAPGVPVISVAASCLLTMAASIPRFVTPDAYERFMVYKTKTVTAVVDETMRNSFAEAWGISVQEQVAIEQYYLDLAEQTTQMPEVVAPKPKDVTWFQTWDDCVLSSIEHEEDAWWLRSYPLGHVLGKFED